MKRFFCDWCRKPMERDRIGRCDECCKTVATEGYPPEDTQVMGYGCFPGGDPRKYFPDPETITPEEYQKWEQACRDAKVSPEKRNLPPGAIPGQGVYQ